MGSEFQRFWSGLVGRAGRRRETHTVAAWRRKEEWREGRRGRKEEEKEGDRVRDTERENNRQTDR